MIDKPDNFRAAGLRTCIRWSELGAVEDAPLEPPRALVTASESLHWMDREIVLPRLAEVVSANGALAILEHDWEGPPLSESASDRY